MYIQSLVANSSVMDIWFVCSFGSYELSQQKQMCTSFSTYICFHFFNLGVGLMNYMVHACLTL